ncbi:MAG: M24 family metallopeptidase [Planctomycetota bacterium JB042]
MSTIPERIRALREQLAAHGLTHYVVPSADEHINEYLPAWRRRREWASGFTGSAGDLVVGTTDDETRLFTDGRYHLQAERELEGTGVGLEKVGAKDATTMTRWLEARAKDRGEAVVVGVDPAVFPIGAAEALEKAVSARGGAWKPVAPNLVDAVWTDRPTPPTSPLIECPIEWTGATVDEKVAKLRAALAAADADAIAVVRLDQIAWLLNLRSTDDIPFNPVFESYLFVDGGAVRLFAHDPAARLPASFADRVAGFSAHPYEEFSSYLADRAEGRVLVDPALTTAGVLATLDANERVTVVRADSPIEAAKAEKNDVELACMRRANLAASVAKTKALAWLDHQLEEGEVVTEASFRDAIERRYADIDGFRGLSFQTISSTGAHGAIIHYSDADETPLCDGDLFLIDSGIQVDGGTTDDTRTVIVGAPTEEQRRRYTLVLKAHVRAANQSFPTGTTGVALDAITRSALWADRLDYGHGTGHGVGAFLNVHEGPVSIGSRAGAPAAALPLKPGMITSIEPGYYEAAFGGIRIENLYVVEEAGEHDGRSWLRFVPLTYVPMDSRLIDESLLDAAELAWLACYHSECRDALAPFLTDKELATVDGWLT